MNRTILTALLALMLGLAMTAAACGASDDDEPAADPTAPAADEAMEPEPTAAPAEPEVMEPEATKVMEEPAEDSRYGGTLRVVSQASIPSLDVAFSGAYVTTAVASHMYETLFGWDNDIQDQPVMVDSWSSSDDSLSWTFTLRDGMEFHDGAPVTADDVRSSYERWLPAWCSLASLMREFQDDDSFVVNDQLSFTINLNEPTGSVVMSIAKPYCSPRIMPSRIDDGVEATTPVEEWVGSGPYQFVRWQQGDRVIIERYDGYQSRTEPASLYTGEVKAYIDELIWLEIPDEETKLAGLETGEWDVVDGAGLDFYSRVSSNADLTVPLYKPGHRTNLLIPPNPPFDQTEARVAFQTGIDVANVMASLGPSELWTLCSAIFFCGTRWETDAGEAELYNLNDKEAARGMLADSGYDGETLVLLNPTDYSTITPTGFVVKSEMEDLGFNVEMPALDWATVVTKFGNPESFAVATSWDVHWNSTSPLEHEAIGSNFPVFPPPVPKLHELRKQFAQAIDEAEKLRLVDELQVEFYRNVPALYLGVFYSIYPATAALKNFEVKAFPYYANSWLER